MALLICLNYDFMTHELCLGTRISIFDEGSAKQICHILNHPKGRQAKCEPNTEKGCTVH